MSMRNNIKWVGGCKFVARLPGPIVRMDSHGRNIIALCSDGNFYMIDKNHKVSLILPEYEKKF